LEFYFAFGAKAMAKSTNSKQKQEDKKKKKNKSENPVTKNKKKDKPIVQQGKKKKEKKISSSSLPLPVQEKEEIKDQIIQKESISHVITEESSVFEQNSAFQIESSLLLALDHDSVKCSFRLPYSRYQENTVDQVILKEENDLLKSGFVFFGSLFAILLVVLVFAIEKATSKRQTSRENKVCKPEKNTVSISSMYAFNRASSEEWGKLKSTFENPVIFSAFQTSALLNCSPKKNKKNTVLKK
jgi:hypothetical protein